MTQPGPRLVAVQPPSTEPPENPTDPRRGARMAFWVLAALVCVCALSAAYQTQQVTRLNGEVTHLNGEVAGLNGALATAHTQLDAYRGRMVEIRGAVSQLRDQLGELDELAQGDPGIPTNP